MARLRPQDAERHQAAGPDFLEALARGLAVLQAFGPERRQMTLAEAARVVDLPRATVRRALLTLTQLGHVETDGRLFRLTPKVLELAAGYLGSNGISTLLQPCCERLSAQTGEACSTAVLHGEEIVFVAYGQPNRMVSMTTMIGSRLPAFCTSLGRVILAGLEDMELDAFLARLKPVPITPQTECDVSVIRARIIKARAQGYALVDQEAELGFRSIAVPLRRYDGRVIAALNLGLPRERATAEAMQKRLLPLLRDAAAQLSERLL